MLCLFCVCAADTALLILRSFRLTDPEAGICSLSETRIYTAPGGDSSLCLSVVKQSVQKPIFLHKSKEMHLTHCTGTSRCSVLFHAENTDYSFSW